MEEVMVVHYIDTPKRETIVFLVARDGDQCAYCDVPFRDEQDHRHSRTVDHYHSIDWCRRQGWTMDKIHDAENLVLAHKMCNSVKSNRAWQEDGTLEPRGRIRAPKVHKVPICITCESGRLLLHGEVCTVCGSGPQPATAPRHLQRQPKDCDHHRHHCFMCFIGHIPRSRAFSDVFGVDNA